MAQEIQSSNSSGFVPYAGLSDTINDVATYGVAKTRLHFGQLFVLGFIAASYLSFATTLSIVAGAGVETPGIQKLVMGIVFPIGLIALVIGGGEMWTGTAMNAPVAGMAGRAAWKSVLYTLIGSYAGNFAGGLFCAWLLIIGSDIIVAGGPGYAKPVWAELLHKMATMKCSLTFEQAFWRAFACVWLVDLAVYLSFRSKEIVGKFFLIWFPTATFFAIGLEHSVVNMFLIPAAIMAGENITWGQFFYYNQLPVTLGNAAAGAICLGLGYWYSAGMPLLKNSSAAQGDRYENYFPTHPEYVHGNSRYLLKTIGAVAGVIIALTVIMPGSASLVSYVAIEGMPSREAIHARPPAVKPAPITTSAAQGEAVAPADTSHAPAQSHAIAPQAPKAPDSFSLYVEPLIILGLFIAIMAIFARTARGK